MNNPIQWRNAIAGLRILYPTDKNVASVKATDNASNEPSAEEIQKFRGLFKSLGGAIPRDQGIRNRRNDLNLASILLHVPKSPEDSPNWGSHSGLAPGGIMTTGNKTANLITPNIVGKFGKFGKHFSIYKISHHGSKADNQLFQKEDDGVPLSTKYEIFLYVAHVQDHTSWHESPVPRTARVFDQDLFKSGVAWLRKTFVANLNLKDEDTNQVIKILSKRHEGYLNRARKGKYVDYGESIFQRRRWSDG